MKTVFDHINAGLITHVVAVSGNHTICGLSMSGAINTDGYEKMRGLDAKKITCHHCQSTILLCKSISKTELSKTSKHP